MSVKFNRIIHPNIQKELYVRHKALENRRSKFVAGTGVNFSDMATRATYAIMTTNYDNTNINKGIQGGEFFERDSAGFDTIIFESLFGFRKDGRGSYRNTTSDGIKPVCGIKSVTVEMNDTTGLRTATVDWSAPSLNSLNEFADFLDFGTNVAVQFGWVYGNRQFPQTFIYYDDSVENIIVDDELFSSPYKKIVESYGNMDALGGVVSNFSSKLRDDGGFDCQTIIMGKGISFLSTIDGPTGLTVNANQAALSDSNNQNFLSQLGGMIFSDPSRESPSEPIDRALRLVTYNDIYHAIANLDLIVSELLDKGTGQPDDSISSVTNIGSTLGNLESVTSDVEDTIGPLITPEQQEEIDNYALGLDFTGTFDLLEDDKKGAPSFLGLGGEDTVDVNGSYRIEPKGFNFFEVSNMTDVTKAYEILGGYSANKNYSNTTDLYVRWGWFEDNILSKYLSLINRAGRVSQTFRSIQHTPNGRVSNHVSYNSKMIPTDFSKVFWASSNWSSDKMFEPTATIDTNLKAAVNTLDELNRLLSKYREFQDDQNPKHGRLRYCFINVKTIQEAFGFKTSTIDEGINGFMKDRPTFNSIENSIDIILRAISESLYGVPDLRISSEADNLMIIDNNLENLESPKAFSNIEEEGFGIFKFPSFEEGSIVKNQQMEISIPKKQAYASYLNAGGGISTKSDEIKEGYRIYSTLSGIQKHTDVPLHYQKPKFGVPNGNERKGFKDTESDNYNFFGGLIELGRWRKIPEKSFETKNEKTDSKEKQSVEDFSENFSIDSETGKMQYRPEGSRNSNIVIDEIPGTNKNATGIMRANYVPSTKVYKKIPLPEGPASMADMFLMDDTPSNTWLESIKMKPAALQIMKSILFDNKNKKTTGGGKSKSFRLRFVDLSLEVDGIGGLRPLAQFNVSYIQPRFNTEIFTEDGKNLGAPIFFVIKNLTQKIDSSGWTTSFGSVMQQNAEAYSYGLDKGLFATNNMIDTLSREFTQFQPETFLNKIKKLLEPLSVAKNKFDNFMSNALDYQEQLEATGSIESDTPYSDAYQKWKTKRDEKKLEKQIDKDVKAMMKSLDHDVIGTDLAPTMNDVDWLLEENRIEREKAEAAAKVKAMGITIPAPEYRSVRSDFTFSPEPVSLNSETANVIFEQNEYANNRDYFNNPDNYEMDDKYLSKKDPLTTMLTSANAIEMPETNLPGFGAGAEEENQDRARAYGLMPDIPEAYVTLPGLGHDMHVAEMNSKVHVVELESDKDAGSQIEQKRGKSVFAQVKGFLFRKRKEEAEVKQAPPVKLSFAQQTDIYVQAEEFAKKFTDDSYENFLMNAGNNAQLDKRVEQVRRENGTIGYDAIFSGTISYMIDEQTEATYTLSDTIVSPRRATSKEASDSGERRRNSVIKYMKAQLMIVIGKNYGDLLGNQETT